MDEAKIKAIVDTQKKWFAKGASLSVERRLAALKRLESVIVACEAEIEEALQKDLGKSPYESYMCEIGMVKSEISYMRKHVRKFAREKWVMPSLAQFPAKAYQKPSPYGNVLIMSPWNYPFLLSIGPLVDAIAAGNTAVIKPSAYSPHTSAIVEKIIRKCFEPGHVAVILGGREENSSLLAQKFDRIFFTGSQAVGKEVMRKASLHLTPVTLELGGKSPCIVEKSADLRVAAKRIVSGKYLNCGQTCVAPDYIYCDEAVRTRLLAELKKQIKKQFGKDPLNNPDYGKIINEKHFHRIAALMEESKIVYGGKQNRATLKIEPTLMDGVVFEDAIMQEEIFGPVLPVITYRSLEQAVTNINAMPHPLALYLFTSDQKVIKKVTERCRYGGGCINDTILHLATANMGFGGFGESGMGSYHGKAGFDTFTHYKSMVQKNMHRDLRMRYQPYKKIYQKIIHIFF